MRCQWCGTILIFGCCPACAGYDDARKEKIETAITKYKPKLVKDVERLKRKD